MPRPHVRPLTFDLTLAADGADNAPARFEGIAYSGGLIPAWNAVIDLASTSVSDSMPLLLGHDQSAAEEIGVAIGRKSERDIQVSGDLFSDIDERARRVAEKARRGMKYQMSVGLWGASEERLAAGKSARINGADFAGPITILRGGAVRETSVVTLGADPATSVNFFSAVHAGGAIVPENHMETEKLQARIGELEAALAAETTRAESAEKRLAAGLRAARETRVRALFKRMGREFGADAAEPYLAMEDTSLAAVEADYAALADRLPVALFGEHDPEARSDGGRSPLLAAIDARYGTTQ